MIEKLQLRGVGKVLQKLRRAIPVSQGQLGNRLKLSKITISKLETDRLGVSLELLGKYAKCFQIPVESIIAMILISRWPKLNQYLKLKEEKDEKSLL